jgi:type II secretory pathway pseudopilin PulG
MSRRRSTAALTLIELLMVVAIVGLLVGLVLPSAAPTRHDQLRAAGRILLGDLAYARSLAVSNGSRYRIVFDPAANRYVLEHSGPSASLDALPDSPFRNPGDPADRHVVGFAELPNLGAPVRLVGAATFDGTYQKVNEVEFGPLGSTTASAPTIVWLATGEGKERLYLSVAVNAVTGLAGVEALGAIGPPASLGP